MNRITVTELEPNPGQQWKCGDEYLPFHPQASHVPPEYRDGWNRCYWMAVAAVARATEDFRMRPASSEAAPSADAQGHRCNVQFRDGSRLNGLTEAEVAEHTGNLAQVTRVPVWPTKEQK